MLRCLGKQHLATWAQATAKVVSTSLRDHDRKLYDLICREKSRQRETISLIASENFTPRYCSEALASCLSAKYSEGYPGNRYYAGNRNIDSIERLCQRRALEAFKLNNDWRVNVQALSGSPANFAVYTGLLNAGDRILFLDLPHGGHLSHGFQTGGKRTTATSKYYTCLPYKLDPVTSTIDYDEVDFLAKRFQPQLIIAGYSAYPRLLDYARFRKIADTVNALLLADIAHIAGPMAAGLIPSAFDHADIVTTTTHKTLRGPRAALIFSRAKFSDLINSAVFPGCQGGPHNHTIAAVAAAMKAAHSQEFADYQANVLENAKALCARLLDHKINISTGGTDNHLLLADLTSLKISGVKAERALELVNIITNKNTVVSDTHPKNPSGLRLGSPAMTTRGFQASDFQLVGDWIARVLEITRERDAEGSLKLKELSKQLEADERLQKLRKDITLFACEFPCVKSLFYEG